MRSMEEGGCAAEVIDSDAEDDELDMDADLLISLTLLRLGIANSLDEMDDIKDRYSLTVDG